MSISVVTLTWNKEPERLRNLLWTLVHQTRPPNEIVIVDGNDDALKQQDTVDAAIPFTKFQGIEVKIILAHMDSFNLSKGINIGIKQTAEEMDTVITTGVDMLFGPNMIEEIAFRTQLVSIVMSQCGFLIEGTHVPEDVYSTWDKLCGWIEPNPPEKIVSGAFMAAPRKWWHYIRGYDEKRYPFAYADSDIWIRAEQSKLDFEFIYWDKAQILHHWHEKSELVSKLGGIHPKGLDLGVIRNLNGWGEYE
jgi:GT2 family glycosyltransferase